MTRGVVLLVATFRLLVLLSRTEDTPPHARGAESAIPAEINRTTSAIHGGGYAEDTVQRYIADSAASRLQLPDEG